MNRIELRFLDAPHVCSMPRRQNPFDIKINPLKKFLLRLLVVSKKHPEHWKYFECENEILFERRRHIHLKAWFVMHPFSILAGLCDIVMLLFYIFDQTGVPFDESRFIDSAYITMIMAYLNVIRQFFTGYIDKEFMVAVIDLKKIALHYFRGWFFLDFIGATPFYYIITNIWEAVGTMDEKYRYHFGLWRLTRVFRIRLFHKCFMATMEYLNAKAVVKRILPLVVYSLIFLHWTTSMLAFLPICIHGENLRNVSESWLNIESENSKKKPIDEPREVLYFLCLFRSAMLLLKLGFGSDLPKTAEDVYTSVILVILGRLLLFVMIQQVLSVNKWVRSPRVRFLAQMRLVKGFLRHREVPQVTRKKVGPPHLRATSRMLIVGGKSDAATHNRIIKYP